MLSMASAWIMVVVVGGVGVMGVGLKISYGCSDRDENGGEV